MKVYQPRPAHLMILNEDHSSRQHMQTSTSRGGKRSVSSPMSLTSAKETFLESAQQTFTFCCRKNTTKMSMS